MPGDADEQGSNAQGKRLFCELGGSLGDIADLMNISLGRVPVWNDDSVCAADNSPGTAFSALWEGTPPVRLALQPLQILSQLRTHLLAISQVLREPDAVPAVLILMRAATTSCGLVFYLLPREGDTRERARRAMNAYLNWTRETLNYLDNPAGPPTVLDRMNRVLEVARAFEFRTTAPVKRSGARAWPDWYVGDRMPSEMDRLSAVMELDLAAKRDQGQDMFRLMSAATHVQAHAVYAIAQVDPASHSEPLNFKSPVAFDVVRVVEWMYTVGALLNRSMILAGDYYGWDLDEWERVTHPRLASWRDAIAEAWQSRGPTGTSG